MKLEDVSVLEHREMQGGYRLLVLETRDIAREVQPGQFVHLRVPELDAAVLRRPFSVFDVDGAGLSILYKAIGRGTLAMQGLRRGDRVSLIGPLGHGFPAAGKDGRLPVLVAGGYGMAALYLVARGSARRGIAFFGGRTAADILCVDAFEKLGWEVRVATDDGALGVKGLVTVALDAWLAKESKAMPEFFACGPNAMLKAVGDRAMSGGWKAWLSMDRNMGCGVGACLTCVQKIRTAEGGWTWKRCCKEGPVFEAGEVVWEEKLET